MRAGEIHIWHVPLASCNSALGELPAVLSDGERERAARFIFEQDEARFIACRASLRLILARYTGIPPSKIIFRYEPRGKPALSGIPGWQFNVSHSRNQAAIAVTRFDPVGIDLEIIDPLFPRHEVVEEILAPDELRDLNALDPNEQTAYFFQLWTLKEALLKAVGGGFSLDPREIRIRLDQSRNPEIVSAPPDFVHATLHRFTLEPRFASALAVLASAPDLFFFTL